jgi:predicted MFS family arabinose efflux permease
VTSATGGGDEEDSQASLLRHRGFLLILASKTASTVASAGTWVVLPLAVYTASGSSALAGLASAMNVVPYILFGAFAGVLVDRATPLRVLIGVELGNAAVLLTVPLLVLGPGLSVAALCVVGFATATVYVWFDVASTALVPAVVGRGRVFNANGHLWSVTTLITATAGPVGFFLLDHVAVGWTFTVFALCSCLSAALLWSARGPIGVPAAPPHRHDARHPLREMADGFRFIARQPTVRLLTLVGIGAGIGSGAVYGMIVVFADRALGLPTDDYRISWIIAGSSVGALLASFAAPRLKRLDPVAVVTALLALDTLLMAGYALSARWDVALGAIVLWNLAHTTLMIVSISVRQVLAPERMQGRVNAAGRMLVWGCVPLGSTLCGVLTEWIGIRHALLVLGTPVAAGLLLAGLTLLRRPRLTPVPVTVPREVHR